MEDIAECIVAKSRMMPLHTGVSFVSGGATITKVAVTGGIGLEVADKKSSLLFAMAEVHVAVVSFLTSGWDQEKRKRPHCTTLTVRHANGLAILMFSWTNDTELEQAIRSVTRVLLHPPVCNETLTTATSAVSFDARGRDGWDINSVDPIDNDPQERSDSEEQDEDE